jgi:fatty acid desaturase
MPRATRNYSIVGPENQNARNKGLVDAEWYQCDIPRTRLKELMKRRNGPALRDTLLWFALLIISGYVAYLSWGTWWAIPAFLIYGVIYMVPAVSKWHEFSHGTPFKTSWMNELMYHVCSFMILIHATNYRWSHTGHHTNTFVVGADPEIFAPRPPSWTELMMRFLSVSLIMNTFKNIILFSLGRLTPDMRAYIPVSEQRKLFWESRIWIILFLGIGALCYYSSSILPLMFIGLPVFYGSPFNYLLVMTQHGGLIDDVLDHRLNTRTFYTNRFLRFLYTNMNYHLEHHMFPLVPYYNLPALHQEIKHDCPVAYPSFRAALKEAVITLWRQRKNENVVATRSLPDTAKPFRFQTQ